MSFYKNRPIPLLEAGPERELMARFLSGTKRIKGLTKALVQTAGVNAKWLKPDEPRNFPVKRLLRIVLYTMHFLGRRIVSDEEQLIRCRFRKPKAGEPFKRLNSATIAQMISYGSRQITSRRVSLVMKAIGFRSERNSKGCYYKLFEMDNNESQRVISDMLTEPEQPKKEEPQQPDLFETQDDLPF